MALQLDDLVEGGADVLLHALCDALLGAASLGDIGCQFPDSDPSFKNASSLDLLKRVSLMVLQAGFRIVNIDSTIAAESPHLSPHYLSMSRNIARALGVPEERIGVKATTTENLGFTGRGEGIAATAVCLLSVKGKGGEG